MMNCWVCHKEIGIGEPHIVVSVNEEKEIKENEVKISDSYMLCVYCKECSPFKKIKKIKIWE